MIFFILLSLFLLIKKKNILLSVAVLAVAAAIKYFSIILLPFIIIYYFRKEKPGKRFLKCIQYGMWFLFILVLCYLFYIRDFHVLQGLFTMQGRITKNFYVILTKYFTGFSNIANKVNLVLMITFATCYFLKCIELLKSKELKFRKQMQSAQSFLMIFLLLVITNFQPWYVMWIFPCFIWQKAQNIKAVIGISIISQFANSIFLIYTEKWDNGSPFTFTFITGSLLMVIINQRLHQHRQVQCFKKKLIKEDRLG